MEYILYHRCDPLDNRWCYDHPMKLIFLDIDGVLNSNNYAEKRMKQGIKYEIDPVDPDALHRLLEVISQTSAKIIISSSWRGLSYKDTVAEFRKKPQICPLIPYIIGVTPRMNVDRRGMEINYVVCHWKWCIEKGLIDEKYKDEKIDKYIIIDDDTDMLLFHKTLFINTSWIEGFTDEDAARAVKILNGTDTMYDVKAKEWVRWLKDRPMFEKSEDIPEIPNLGKAYTDKYFVEELVKHGAIPRDQLEAGKTYIGSCRNAHEAVWDGKEFIYKRTKFGSTFDESINHFQDDDGYDVFIPIKLKQYGKE